MKLNIYDENGKKTQKTVELSETVWNVPLNADVIAQAVTIYLHNRRRGTAHSKTRAEVRGGGRKPWRQKGTGRARHGSIRSPLWTKGGVAFGPRTHKTVKKFPQKMAHAALRSLLSERARGDQVKVMEGFGALGDSKTKSAVKFFGELDSVGKSVLVVLASGEEKSAAIKKSVRNIGRVQVKSSPDVNPYDVSRASRLIIGQDSIAELEKRIS